MNIWIITDTHFGHEKIIDFCNRPKNFEKSILKNMQCVRDNDVLIHLGDVAWKNEKYWNEIFLKTTKAKKWLVLGNHDKKSITWYLERGWDFVGDTISLDIYGKKILFSHIPIIDIGYDINVHGHFHNISSHYHEIELIAIRNKKHYLVYIEHHYRPVTLKSIINIFNSNQGGGLNE